jgi:antitoxin Phd
LQEAKSRLSQVVDHALREGPQTITLRGKPAVVVVSFEEFQTLTRPATSLREFFRQSPLYDTDLDLERSKDVSREVPL